MLAYIALGGILGTLARYVLQGWLQARTGLATFPVGTLAINLAGSFAIGFIVRLATGSTVITPELRADGEYWSASLYMGGTVAGCLGAVLAGTALASALL